MNGQMPEGRQSNISRVLTQQELIIGNLQELIARLEDKITPVLMSAHIKTEQKPSDAAIDESIDESALASAITCNNSHIENQCATLRNLISRIDL